jgi:hypothetical protein
LRMAGFQSNGSSKCCLEYGEMLHTHLQLGDTVYVSTYPSDAIGGLMQCAASVKILAMRYYSRVRYCPLWPSVKA